MARAGYALYGAVALIRAAAERNGLGPETEQNALICAITPVWVGCARSAHIERVGHEMPRHLYANLAGLKLNLEVGF